MDFKITLLILIFMAPNFIALLFINKRLNRKNEELEYNSELMAQQLKRTTSKLDKARKANKKTQKRR